VLICRRGSSLKNRRRVLTVIKFDHLAADRQQYS
jgi:hypothetical protein